MPELANPLSNSTFRTRYYSVATTSTSGAPTSTVIVASRCKYLGGWFVPNQIAGTGAQAEGFDVVSITGATSVATGSLAVISSGVAVSSSTGAFATPFSGVGATAATGVSSALLLNPGDLIVTLASTCQSGFITHIVGEF